MWKVSHDVLVFLLITLTFNYLLGLLIGVSECMTKLWNNMHFICDISEKSCLWKYKFMFYNMQDDTMFILVRLHGSQKTEESFLHSTFIIGVSNVKEGTSASASSMRSGWNGNNGEKIH